MVILTLLWLSHDNSGSGPMSDSSDCRYYSDCSDSSDCSYYSDCSDSSDSSDCSDSSDSSDSGEMSDSTDCSNMTNSNLEPHSVYYKMWE